MHDRMPDLRQIVTALQAQAPDLAQQCADAVRQYAPVRKGQLRDSLTGESESTEGGAQLRVVSDVPQAAWVTQGTAPHAIVPTDRHALRFTVQGGTVVFAKRVNHPGTSPNDFGMDAADAIEAIVEQAVDAAVQAVAQ